MFLNITSISFGGLFDGRDGAKTEDAIIKVNKSKINTRAVQESAF